MNWKKIALGGTLAATLLFSGMAGQALAHWGCYAPGQSAATPGDQAKIDGVRQQYGAELAALEAKLRTTSRDLDRAMVDQDSATTNELRQELYDLEREYDTVRDRAWGEMSEAGVAANWGHGGWNCRWYEGHDWASGGRATASRWGGHRGSCCW